ncbi:Gfo/Idh/MocA family oxidoreductase [Georgenia sp. TF02-10]|uniref:Gfo/Idh/MocA family protein n=1 Tax=Georgenia sp. TF02-10 TaxID=2917725 RepID=UPI001FA76B15|nr:Gfo/Idh/MocA family oxidoreductase [Georgenia sp. TF02-10]UNX54296.1 Gfo/Idh/MocA family oxidoreductase [Georgenia sp. TF02-10]
MSVKVAVVGAGWWSGTVHLPAIVDHPDAELVAVCDADGERARTAAEMFGAARWVTDVAALPGLGVDCAIVATPHDAHHQPTVQLLDAGVDVLVEKPMAIHPAEAWGMVAAAERSGARLHVGYPFLHSHQAAELRRVVRDGDIGTPVLLNALFATAVQGFYRGDLSVQRQSGAPFSSRAETYASASRGGGQLLTQATHAVALALWCLEDDVRTVTGLTAVGPATEVDVVDALTARTASGTLLTVSSTGTVHHNDERVERYSLFGTVGHAFLDTAANTVVLHRPGRGGQVLADASHGPANAVHAPLDALLAGRSGGVAPVVGGELGARVVETQWAARESAATGGAVGPEDWVESTQEWPR